MSPYRVAPMMQVARPAPAALPDELGWVFTVAGLGALRLAIAWVDAEPVDREVGIAVALLVVAGGWLASRLSSREPWTPR